MNPVSIVIYTVLSILVLVGLSLQSKVRSAAAGNFLAMGAMVAAIIYIIIEYSGAGKAVVWIGLCIGLIIGLVWAFKVKMVQMPQTVGLLNGIGGLASAMVGSFELLTGKGNLFAVVTSGLAVAVGCITFMGSLVAALKLAGKMNGRPRILPGHSTICTSLLIAAVIGIVMGCFEAVRVPAYFIIALSTLAFGYFFAIRVGGADMPITISLLNSLSGVAGAIAGMAIYNILLVAIGGIVGSSGVLLTQIMCRAMNRRLSSILLGKSVAKPAPRPAPVEEAVKEEVPAVKAAETAAVAAEPAEVKEAPAAEAAAVPTLAEVKDLIIVPGYGMALSQAQHKVKELADMMEARGCRVRYAIHPVAGRMPGHMNVLLAEVDVDYDLLCELESINDDFKNCDAVLVVGASDVMNPAAREAEGTPIYGMPILNVDQAPMVFVCNYNLAPGYAGVPNPIYDRKEGIRILLGDAKESLQTLIGELSSAKKAAAVQAPAAEEKAPEAPTLADVKDLIIVPGYGMALSQAQSKVKTLADMMEARGCRVRYAIHPVAGRMPGHMNVLLAEVDVDYDLLCELDAINDDFKNCDAVLVVGASDVMNPAAREAEGTPIYGMPILNVDQAPMVFVCNYNLEPGYAGVPNPIYDRKEGIRILLGDAKDSLQTLIDELSAKKTAPEAAPSEAAPAVTGNPDAARTLAGVKDLIIVPGYGMALSQAQSKVKSLADMMEAAGCRVRYAIHPVAGRMPGHMNVLLAEVDVDYDLLCELDAINDDFAKCDAVLVVGASDVMNPAAREAEGTPIYGMPILNVDQAPMVFVCNYNLEPGYAGVPNPIYDRESGIRILLGDAKDSLQTLMDELRHAKEAPAAAAPAEEAAPAGNPDANRTLEGVKDLIIVPGYGMALSQAQRMVKRLADKMESKGCRVRYAIHPVAGRMPGHMNVLLAEVDVDYDLLCELDAINDDFKNCDAVLVVGASDVMNPAAREAEGTPIYGMPILNVDQAPMVFVCNYNLEPGYAGVPNPIYDRESGIRILLGDAKESLQILLDELN